jgi:class 3 adenylate cyclase
MSDHLGQKSRKVAFRHFNDISIRGKLTAIVAAAVAVLTTGVLISVWIMSWQEVRNDVRSELQLARHDFVITEGEHLHEHALEAATIAESEELLPFLMERDSKAACSWLAGLLAGKSLPVNPEDSIDLLGVVSPNQEPLGIVAHGEARCTHGRLKSPLPSLSNKQSVSEITNWESDEKKLYELIAAPILDAHDRDVGSLIMGFEVTDTLARHIKEHTGQDNIVWHEDGNESHLLGASSPSIRPLLRFAVENWRTGMEQTSDGYAILDASIEDHADLVLNPSKLHVALVQSLDVKFEPFRRLEYLLASMAVLALLLGWILGRLLARPIATPLANLARAAESVTRDQMDTADQLLQGQSERLIDAKDEIGVLGRSFREMVQGLKERLAMFPFMSDATLIEIRSKANGRSANTRASLAILFADVRQFTTFSETRDPEEVIGLLNEVLSIEAEITKKHNGDIDKFVGDALIAWFSGDDRCARAVRAADEMISTLQSRFGGRPGTTIGVGIHVGEVVVGSIGSRARMDYTAIGSAVNLAARLCASAVAGQILVSQAVKLELADDAALKPLPPISLKGIQAPVAVFEVSMAAASGA